MKRLLALFLLIALSSCATQIPVPFSVDVGKVFPSVRGMTRTPFQPASPTATATAQPTATPQPSPSPTATPPPDQPIVWLDPSLPPALKSAIHLPQGVQATSAREAATLEIGALRGGPPLQSRWIYALVAPFPTIPDDVSLKDIQKAWRGEDSPPFKGSPLLVSLSTQAAFAAAWGPPSEKRVRVVSEDSLVDTAWSSRPSWAIIPFEALEPRWKALSVDGVSPLDKGFDAQSYPLAINFGISGDQAALAKLLSAPGVDALMPNSNRDPQKLTTLVMTGTTALVRAIAAKMDVKGVNYPARDIRDWLLSADLLHISNEVSFNKSCPPGDAYSESFMFCSRPEYIGLLDYIGADIIELSGNHNNDWGTAAFTYSLELYKERGWLVYAGGASLEEARAPRTIERNGNRLAFIGCNPAGPDFAWATESEPGVASCDYPWMLDQIRALKQQGYLPIVTLQYFEHYIYTPTDAQQADFRQFADAGAVIVSGSQSHYPQTMEFYQGAFIHYGLGNLFFDQMDTPVEGTRREFIDRYVIYDGRLISAQLLTAMLEEYARPRPMTQEEREQFLNDIFTAAGW